MSICHRAQQAALAVWSSAWFRFPRPTNRKPARRAWATRVCVSLVAGDLKDVEADVAGFNNTLVVVDRDAGRRVDRGHVRAGPLGPCAAEPGFAVAGRHSRGPGRQAWRARFRPRFNLWPTNSTRLSRTTPKSWRARGRMWAIWRISSRRRSACLPTKCKAFRADGRNGGAPSASDAPAGRSLSCARANGGFGLGHRRTHGSGARRLRSDAGA